MEISYDPAKHQKNIMERGFGFDHAAEVFTGPVLEFPDERQDYGETRIVTVGFLQGRMMIVVWTLRGSTRHIISMRKANDREQRKFTDRLG